MGADEERIALFLDYENLAIGAREGHKGSAFALKPLADVLAERGRVVVRRAYADWSFFESDRRMLTENHVELIEIPQRPGAVRKNAADIKMAVDAVELSFERAYITTFVIATGDSDFTPLVDKLRALNKFVIGCGLENSTSALLPPACDEFLFYERLEGVDVSTTSRPRRQRRGSGGGHPGRRAPAVAAEPAPEPAAAAVTDDSVTDLPKLVTQTLSGLQRSSGGAVLASALKRAILRKDPTFNEANYGFRAFGELLRHLEGQGVIELSAGSAKGDPEVGFSEADRGEEETFALLRHVVADLQARGGPPPLSGLKDQMRKREPGFSEKAHGYGGFLQFCKAAQTRGAVEMRWDDDAEDYLLMAGAEQPAMSGGSPTGA